MTGKATLRFVPARRGAPLDSTSVPASQGIARCNTACATCNLRELCPPCCNAIALEDSEVCAIPFARLQELAHEIPRLQRHFHRTMSREIVREQGVMLLLGRMNSDERLAVFLLNLSQHFAACGCSPWEFNLRMTREEIGSYLRLTLETVSRTLSRFQDEGLIQVQQKFIRILDNTRLERVMGRQAD